MKKIILVFASLLLSACLFCSCALFDELGGMIKEKVSTSIDSEVKELLAAFDDELDLDNFSSDELRELYEKIFKNGDILDAVKTVAGFDGNGGTGDEDDGTVSDEWSDNALTKNVPQPPFNDQTVVFGEDSVTVKSSDTTLDGVKEYARTLAGAGFDTGAVEDEQSVAGITVYSYTAKNADGASVSMTFAAGTTTLSVN